MTVTPSSPTVGIFKDRSMAEQAIDALHNVGFTSEQVRYSAPGTSGSILADLKNLFTGQNTNSGNITNDLTDMGLSNEEAQYYANEHANGNTILAVLASGREQEALNILHQYGAYNARTSNSSSTTTYPQQPSNVAQQADTTTDDASLQQQPTSWSAQQQPASNEDRPLQDEAIVYPTTTTENNAPEDVSTTQSPEYQAMQPLTPGYHSTPQDTQASNLAIPASTSDNQATPVDTLEQTSDDNQATPVAVDQTSTPDDNQATPVDTLNQTSTPDDNQVTPVDTLNQTPATDNQATPVAVDQTSTTDNQATSSDQATPLDTGGSDSTPDLQNTRSAIATSEPADEFQQLQEQLQAAQQQLQDARAQLQAAKEHEAQIQTIREREQKLQTARQQLQDIQAQLQATLAELHETQGRISQY